MEGNDVHVVNGGSGDEPEPWNPARSSWIAAATAFGLGVALTLLFVTARSSDTQPIEPPVAAPLATTTSTSLLPVSTTTTTQPLTTTIPVGQTIRDVADDVEPRLRDFCDEASAMGSDGLIGYDEWVGSMAQTGWLPAHGDFVESLLSDIWDAGQNLYGSQASLWYSIATDLDNAHGAFDDAWRTEGQGSEWAFHVARLEAHCSKAIQTLVAMLAMTAD